MTILKTSLFVALALFSSMVVAQTYTVKNGDSLWKIAEKTKSSSVTIHQMIAAIHEKNAAVLGADIGRIVPGMVLDLPLETEVSVARDEDAEYLLIGNAKQTSTISITSQIESIEKHISQIETQIYQTIASLKASNASLEKTITE